MTTAHYLEDLQSSPEDTQRLENALSGHYESLGEALLDHNAEEGVQS